MTQYIPLLRKDFTDIRVFAWLLDTLDETVSHRRCIRTTYSGRYQFIVPGVYTLQARYGKLSLGNMIRVLSDSLAYHMFGIYLHPNIEFL